MQLGLAFLVQTLAALLFGLFAGVYADRWNRQRTMIVTDNMMLTAAESDEFWPLYREYRTEVAKLNDRFISVVQRYAKQFESLSDDEAMSLLKESFRIDIDRLKLAQKYSKKFNRFLPGSKVARFMQIEARLDAVLDLKVKNSIPLAM